MGLRSPQEMQKVQINRNSSVRFQGATAPKIDTAFLSNAAQGLKTAEALRLKREKDQLAFLEADMANEGDRLRVEAQAKLSLAQGVNSIDEAKSQKDFIARSLDKKLNNIDERFRPQVKQQVDKTLLQFDTYALPYSYGQVKKVQDETYKTRTANDMNIAVEGSGDIDYLAGPGLQQVANSIKFNAQRKYGDDPNREISPGIYARDLIDNDIRRGVSETIRKSVELQSTMGRTDLATKTLASLQQHMTPADKAKAIKLIDSAEKDTSTDQALSMSGQILNEADGNLALAEAILKDRVGGNGRVYTQALSMMRGVADLQEKQKLKDVEATRKAVFDKVEKGQNYMADLKNLPWEERNKVLKSIDANRGVAPKATNWDSYQSAYDLMLNRPEEALRRPDLLASIRDQIAPDKMRSLENMYETIKKANTDDKARTQVNGYKMVNDITTRFMSENNINPKGTTGKRIRGDMLEIVDRILPNNPTQEELRRRYTAELRRRAIVNVPVEGSGIFGFFQDKRKELGETMPAEMSDQSSGVHPEVINAIRSKYPNASQEQINRAIQNMQTQGWDLTRPVPRHN